LIVGPAGDGCAGAGCGARVVPGEDDGPDLIPAGGLGGDVEELFVGGNLAGAGDGFEDAADASGVGGFLGVDLEGLVFGGVWWEGLVAAAAGNGPDGQERGGVESAGERGEEESLFAGEVGADDEGDAFAGFDSGAEALDGVGVGAGVVALE
jgi:hypothetical protein